MALLRIKRSSFENVFYNIKKKVVCINLYQGLTLIHASVKCSKSSYLVYGRAWKQKQSTRLIFDHPYFHSLLLLELRTCVVKIYETNLLPGSDVTKTHIHPIWCNSAVTVQQLCTSNILLWYVYYITYFRIFRASCNDIFFFALCSFLSDFNLVEFWKDKL